MPGVENQESAAGRNVLLIPAADWALFLDVDGTLLDIAPAPDAVIVPADLPAVLRRAAQALGGALALVSGRPLSDLDALFAPTRLAAAGEHGAEIRPEPYGAAQRIAPALPPALLAAVRSLARQPGVLVETKQAGVAVHYRHAPGHGEALHRELAQAVAAHAPGVAILRGKMVWELRWSWIGKGRAVSALLEQPPFRGRRPVFIGDDVTDEEGMAAATAAGGLAGAVGELNPARWPTVFSAATEVRDWLADLPFLLRKEER